MATLCVRRLWMPELATACRRSLSVAAKGGELRSHVEVERKFVPTQEMKDMIDDSITMQWLRKMNPGLGPECERWGNPPESFLSALRLPDSFLRDRYYDLNDQLSGKGIWIRQRRISRTVRKYQTDLINDRPGTFEAKIRLQGDFANSQFHEIKGKSKIAALLKEHLPGVKFQDLGVLADLRTFRKSWKVVDSDSDMHIVFDRSGLTRPHPNTILTPRGMSEQDVAKLRFEHEVGEVEITKEVVGGADKVEHDKLRREAAGQMDVLVGDLMREYPKLFVISPKPKGKLTAFFDWKRDAERDGTKSDK